MSRLTIVNLMTGVALAALVSGSTAWAQTATEQSEELLQQQQQQVTPPAGEATEAPAAGTEAEAGAEAEAEVEAQTDTQLPEEQVTEEAPAAEEQQEQVTEEAPAEQPQDEVTEAPEADETTEAQQQQDQQQTQETTVNVDIDQSQETVIRQTVLDHPNIEPVSVDLIDFELAVGAVVTSTAVALHPVPVEIVQAVPRFRGHLHFVLADERIVIVDPCTLRVVTIIA